MIILLYLLGDFQICNVYDSNSLWIEMISVPENLTILCQIWECTFHMVETTVWIIYFNKIQQIHLNYFPRPWLWFQNTHFENVCTSSYWNVTATHAHQSFTLECSNSPPQRHNVPLWRSTICTRKMCKLRKEAKSHTHAAFKVRQLFPYPSIQSSSKDEGRKEAFWTWGACSPHSPDEERLFMRQAPPFWALLVWLSPLQKAWILAGADQTCSPHQRRLQQPDDSRRRVLRSQ